MPTKEFDLIAIGGGTAGLVAASGGAYLGARVALIEKHRLGGDCLWTGCVPSKAILAAARSAEESRRGERLGLPPLTVTPDFGEVIARVRGARALVARHDEPDRIRARGIDVYFGSARFTGSGTVDVEGVGTLRSKRIVLATGARPAIPPIPGLGDAEYLTHETAFDQDTLPASIVILGGGPIGLEFAQAYRRLGAEVTVIERLGEALPLDDPEAAGVVRRMLAVEGVRFAFGATASAVERVGGSFRVLTADGREFGAESIFVATGRRPNIGELALTRGDVDVTGGAVRVDARLRTTARGVWAAGDVTGGPQFTHAADAMAKTVVRNALLPLSSKSDLSNVPRVTYTDPEIAHVGLSHTEAEARDARVYRYEFGDLDRAIADGATAGFTKISADRRGRILGATVVGRSAGELLMPVVLARRHGLRLADISSTIFPYPTMAEGLKRTADAYQRGRLAGTAGKVLRGVVRWLK